jgi:hypothetical protein
VVLTKGEERRQIGKPGVVKVREERFRLRLSDSATQEGKCFHRANCDKVKTTGEEKSSEI